MKLPERIWRIVSASVVIPARFVEALPPPEYEQRGFLGLDSTDSRSGKSFA
jgi:hypothetical protein